MISTLLVSNPGGRMLGGLFSTWNRRPLHNPANATSTADSDARNEILLDLAQKMKNLVGDKCNENVSSTFRGKETQDVCEKVNRALAIADSLARAKNTESFQLWNPLSKLVEVLGLKKSS